MKILVMIALIVAVLAGVGSLYFINELGKQKTTLIAEKNDLTTKWNDTTAALNKSKSDLDGKIAELAAKETELDTTKQSLTAARIVINQKEQEVEQLNTEVAGLKKSVEEKTTEMASLKETMDKLQEVMGKTDVKGIEDIKARVEALDSENKLLSQHFVVTRAENDTLKKRVEELSVTPVGLRGKVAMVNDSWNFLVIDIGRGERVQPNTLFLVYRDNKMVGKVKVVSVSQTTSVAELLPEFKRGTPRAGDLVIH